MKILFLIISGNFGKSENSGFPAHLHDDIRFTNCQNDFFESVLGKGVPKGELENFVFK